MCENPRWRKPRHLPNPHFRARFIFMAHRIPVNAFDQEKVRQHYTSAAALFERAPEAEVRRLRRMAFECLQALAGNSKWQSTELARLFAL